MRLTWKWDNEEGKRSKEVYDEEGLLIASFPYRKAIDMGVARAKEANDTSTAYLLAFLKAGETVTKEVIEDLGSEV